MLMFALFACVLQWFSPSPKVNSLHFPMGELPIFCRFRTWCFFHTKYLKHNHDIKTMLKNRTRLATGWLDIKMYIKIGFHSGTFVSVSPSLHMLQVLSQCPVSIPYCGWVVHMLSVPEMGVFPNKTCQQSKLQEKSIWHTCSPGYPPKHMSKKFPGV